jgi:hypothetical protein
MLWGFHNKLLEVASEAREMGAAVQLSIGEDCRDVVDGDVL